MLVVTGQQSFVELELDVLQVAHLERLATIWETLSNFDHAMTLHIEYLLQDPY